MPKVPSLKLTSYKGGKVGPVSKTLAARAPGLTLPVKPTAVTPQVFPTSEWAKAHLVQGAPGAAAASANLPPGKPPPFAPGISGAYEQTVAGNNANLKNQLGAITQAEDAGASEFGFNVKYKPEVGPAGEREIESLTVDPSNPFSRAALLQRSYDQAKRGATNSYAARGQLYAGSLQNAQDENAYGFQRGDDSLRKAFAEFMLGKKSERFGAAAANTAANAAAYGTALGQQLSTTPEDPGPDPATDPEVVAGINAAVAGIGGPKPPAQSPSTRTASAVASQTAAAQAQAQSQANANAAAGGKPKPGYAYIMKSGPRANQSYNIVTNKDGSKSRVFANGQRERI